MEFELTVLFILICRNVVDLAMSAHKGDALTTNTNPAYEMMKEGGEGEEEEEGARGAVSMNLV